jgi:hypothetical protein
MLKLLAWPVRFAMIGAGVGAWLLFHALSAAPGLAERIYGNGIGPLLASMLSSLTGTVPVSLAELLVLAFLVRQLWGLAGGIAEVRAGERGPLGALLAGAVRLAADLGLVVALFYVLWGFNYARPPLEQRQQWNGREADVEELARLANEMVEAANFEYAGIAGGDDLGSPSRAPARGELIDQLDAGWREASGVLGSPATAVTGFGDPKPLFASFVLDYTLTSGFYFPWTAEANYNAGTPHVSLPHVIAHEMSHQRGFAREDEANFTGFLAAAAAPAPYARYSAYVFAQGQLLATLSRYDRDRAVALAANRLPGVQRDLTAARAYWAQFEGPASRTSRSMYDAYLRGQRVPEGVVSYSRSVELLVAYARSRGGWLVRR